MNKPKIVAKNLLFTKEEEKAFDEMVRESQKPIKLIVQVKKSNNRIRQLLEKL